MGADRNEPYYANHSTPLKETMMDKATLDAMNEQVLAEFRANDGVVGGRFEGMPVLLMHHKGAKSGKVRVNPLVYSTDGDRYVIICSKGGAPKNPDWYHNLIAHPDIDIEVGTETIPVTAQEVFGDERRRLYDQQAEIMPFFKEYEKAAAPHREIPVIVFTRR